MPFEFQAPIRRGLSAILTLSLPLTAGVVNPNISAIGQVLGGVTDDIRSPDRKEPVLKLGEAEFVLDAYLNPYFTGWFTVAAGEEGLEVEEAYTAMVKGLPFGLGIKAGKYRLGFGKLNPIHPHAYPFPETPRAWMSLMPGGEEGFNETAAQISCLLPTPGDWASMISVDVLQGSTFHPDAEETRLGWMGRWSNSFLLWESGAADLGLSGATGLDDVESDARGYLAGADFKAKFYLPGSSQITVQGEGLFRRSHHADSLTGLSTEERRGLYAFVDYRHRFRTNAGALYEQGEREGEPARVDQAVKLFAGYAVLEESTVLRLAYEHFMPDGEDAVRTISLQLLFRMGPHKAHQF